MYRDIEDATRANRSQDVGRASTPKIQDRTHEQDGQRTIYELRDKSYRLNVRESRLLSDVGQFRAIQKADLLKTIYKSNQAAFDGDLRHLHRQGLVRIVGPKGSITK